MERLTSEINGRAVPVKFDLDFTLDMPQRDWRGLQEIFDRLAAYEETGLEPEEIERILNSYGRGMTLRTENAQRLGIIKEIPINRLRELAQAEKEERLVVLQNVKYTDSDGEKALRHAMYMCGVQNNPVTRYTADAIAEKLTREAAEAALKERAAERDRYKAERDAAVNDLKYAVSFYTECFFCKYETDEGSTRCGKKDCWEWRGLEENT